MKRALLVLFTFLALSYAQAQASYFGIRADVHYFPNAGPGVIAVLPLPGFQLGFPIQNNLELRASWITLLLINILQLDILYTQDLSDTLRIYGGVGGNLGVFFDFTESYSIYGVHATAGVEYQVGSGIGLFGEVQPIYISRALEYLIVGGVGSGLGFIGKLNVGINFHF